MQIETPEKKKEAVKPPLFLVLLLILVWTATRPYRGTEHDAALYTVQALSKLYSHSLSNDLYLQYGSQADFSLYSELLAIAIRLAGVPFANLSLTLTGQALWITGALLLAQAIGTTRSDRAALLVALFALPSGYGGLGIFHYAEPFQSPRIFAEAFALMALALALQDAWRRALFLMAMAFLSHAIMALAPAAVMFLLAARQSKKAWLLPLLGLPTLFALYSAAITPFDRLGITFDPAWWEVVERRARFALITAWDHVDYSIVISQANILYLSYTASTRRIRYFIVCLTSTVFLAYLFNYLAVDHYKNLFATNLQPYRAGWLLSAVSNALCGILFLRTLSRREAHAPPLLTGVIVYALSSLVPLLDAIAAITLTAASITATLQRSPETYQRLAKPITQFAFATGIICLSISMIVTSVYVIQIVDFSIELALRSLTLLLIASIGVALYEKGMRRTAIATIAVGALASVATYVQLSPQQRLVSALANSPDVLDEKFGDAINIYWEDGADYMWLGLQRPNYFSCKQGSGSMFYRSTAMEYHRRGVALSRLGSLDFDISSSGFCLNTPRARSDDTVTAEDITSACTALPELNLIVLLDHIPEAKPIVWQMPLPIRILRQNNGRFEMRTYDSYQIYDCDKLRLKDSSQPNRTN